jgi:hypothetical protein
MHQAAVADGSQQKRNRKIMPQNARAEIAIRFHNRMARTESYVLENSAVFAKGYFPFGSAIKVVEYRFRNSFLRGRTQIVNADNAR